MSCGGHEAACSGGDRGTLVTPRRCSIPSGWSGPSSHCRCDITCRRLSQPTRSCRALCGLIARRAGQRPRAKHLMLTAAGVEYREKLLASLLGDEPLLSGLPRQEKATLQDLLERALGRT